MNSMENPVRAECYSFLTICHCLAVDLCICSHLLQEEASLMMAEALLFILALCVFSVYYQTGTKACPVTDEKSAS